MPAKKRILLVDDEVTITRTLKLYLEGTGAYEVRTENRGSAALQAARGFKPDLILLDVAMPDMDGGDVAAEIRSDEELKKTPIVFLTALVKKQEVVATGGDIGGFPYIAKPLEPEKIIEVIERHTS